MAKNTVLILSICLCANLFAHSVYFTETKYISIQRIDTKKNGTIIFDTNKIKLQYENSKDIYLYTPSKITINSQKFANNEQIELDLFFKVIEAIYQNNTDRLTNDFNITSGDEIILLPKGYLSHAISSIKFKKSQHKLDYLRINFRNNDYTEIVETIK